MSIIVKVSDLLWKVREMNRDKMDYVVLDIHEKDSFGDGEDDVIPRQVSFVAFKEDEPSMEIDYETVDESPVDRDDSFIVFTNIK